MQCSLPWLSIMYMRLTMKMKSFRVIYDMWRIMISFPCMRVGMNPGWSRNRMQQTTYLVKSTVIVPSSCLMQ